jgi:hypothetical protein
MVTKLPYANMTTALPWIDILAEDGMIVAVDPKTNHKSLVATARLTEPYSELWTAQQAFGRTTAKINAHFRSESSLGPMEQLQILRRVSADPQAIPLELTQLAEDIAPVVPMAEETAHIYQEWARGFHKDGMVTRIDTWLFITFSLGTAIVSQRVADESKVELLRRIRDMAEVFTNAGYGFEILRQDQDLLEPLWKYCNPKTSQHVAPPKVAKKEIRKGNFNPFNLARNPHLAPGTIRRQVGTSSYSFTSGTALGDETYQALLQMSELPDDAQDAFSPLYAEMLDMPQGGNDVWVSQTWLMEGKSKAAKKLKGSARVADDLNKGFGESSDNSELQTSINNIESLRSELVNANQIISYTCTIRVDAPNRNTLYEGVLRIQNAINSIAGAQVRREDMPNRVQRSWLQCAPAVPSSLVDYKYRGHTVRADRASFWLPRHGAPLSDPVKQNVPYSIFWTPGASPVRISALGVANSGVSAVYGPMGTGKTALIKSISQQYLAFPNSYCWYIDNNTDRTSVDYQVRGNGGVNIRLVDTSDICLPTFEIAGDTPNTNERALLAELLWFDIQRGKEGENFSLTGNDEVLLDQLISRMYKTDPNKPKHSSELLTYDDACDVLLEWEDDEYTPTRKAWVKNLEPFCSGRWLTELYGQKYEDGKYYRLFGRRDGLTLKKLLNYRMVSWNLEGITNEFLKKKVCLLLKKSIMTFAILLSDLGVVDGNYYFFSCAIDEGWSIFRLDNSGKLLEELLRKHRHVNIQLLFMTQFLSDLDSAMGKDVIRSATQFFILGSGDEPERESELLELSPVEQEAIMRLDKNSGYYATFYFRRRQANGLMNSYILLNPVPYTRSGSWFPLLTGERDEGILRERILRLLEVESINSATPEQLIETFRIYGHVWPNGFPSNKEDINRKTQEDGWLEVLELVDLYKARQNARKSMEAINICAE